MMFELLINCLGEEAAAPHRCGQWPHTPPCGQQPWSHMALAGGASKLCTATVPQPLRWKVALPTVECHMRHLEVGDPPWLA